MPLPICDTVRMCVLGFVLMWSEALFVPWMPVDAILPPKEQKVHNIVLYPDKHSWCKVTPIKQVITEQGCQSKSIDNNVCVGTCFSFSVPKTIPESPGEDQLHYCDSCQSSESTWITVTLECPEDTNRLKVEKSVEIIGNCSCTSCRQHTMQRRPSVPDEDPVEYDQEEENLKQMYNYEIQQFALKHALKAKSHGGGGGGGGISGTPSPNDNTEPHPHHHRNKLDLLEEDASETDDDESFRQLKSVDEK